MKQALFLLVLLSISSCKKDDKDVVYRVTSVGCTMHYVEDGSYHIEAVHAHDEYRSRIVDTVLNSVDTTITVIDTVSVPTTWTKSITEEHDDVATMEMVPHQDGSAQVPATLGAIEIDGIVVVQKVAIKAGEKIVLSEP